MKTFKEYITEVSADSDILTREHETEYKKASNDLKDVSSAAGRIRRRDFASQQKKKELRDKAKNFKEKANRHLEAIRKIRKQYKEKGE